MPSPETVSWSEENLYSLYTTPHSGGQTPTTLTSLLEIVKQASKICDSSSETTSPDSQLAKHVIILQQPSLNELQQTLQSFVLSNVVIVASGGHYNSDELNELKTLPVTVVDAEFSGSAIDAVTMAMQQEKSSFVLISENSNQSTEKIESGESLDEGNRRPRVISPSALVPEEIARRDRQAIWKKTFSKEARRWISQYNSVGHRDLYLWQWCLHGIELTRLPTVDPEWEKFVDGTKLLSVILCVLFDDVADQGQAFQEDAQDQENETSNIPSGRWLQALIRLTRNEEIEAILTGNESVDEHLRVTEKLWKEYVERVGSMSNYSVFESLWKFDIEQFLTAMRYGQLINSMPSLANPTEHDVYTPHNMLMVSFSTIDLMCSEDVTPSDVGRLREAVWHAQAMGRIGNVLSTWRRELNEGDISNGLIARAIADGVFSSREVKTLSTDELERTLVETGYEDELLTKWNDHRTKSREIASRVNSTDLHPVLDAHDRFLQMHLGSHGLI